MYRLCNKIGVIAMSSVVIATLKDSDRLRASGWQGTEEANEAYIIFDLQELSTEDLLAMVGG